MTRAMVFIDGTWLRINIPRMAVEENFEPRAYRVHFGLLLDGLKELLAKSKELRIEPKEIDIVRTYIFGHIPINVHEDDRAEAAGIETFYDIIEKEFGYDAELFELNYRGRRLNEAPPEKCVDIALASSMLYYAAIPYAYDIAIVVLGDQDFVPVLQRVRTLGRRVAIASIKTRKENPCSQIYSQDYDEERVRDFDVIWLNDLAARIQIPERIIECQDAGHVGKRKAVTTAVFIEGKPEICDECRGRNRVRRREEQSVVSERLVELERRGWPAKDGSICGVVATKGVNKYGKTFAFVRAKVRGQTNDYYLSAQQLRGCRIDEVLVTEFMAFIPGFAPPDRFSANEARKVSEADWNERAVQTHGSEGQATPIE